MSYLLHFYVRFCSRFFSYVPGEGCGTEICVCVDVRFTEIKYSAHGLYCGVLTCNRLSFKRREKVKFQ